MEIAEILGIMLSVSLPFMAMVGVFEGVLLIKIISIIFLVFCLRIAINHGSTMPIYWLLLIASSSAFTYCYLLPKIAACL